jgi:hypothetical protein
MGQRTRRILLVVSIAAVLGSVTSPAQATTHGDLDLEGTAVMGAGIAYPCIGPVQPSFDPSKCGGFLTSSNAATLNLTAIVLGSIGHGPTKGGKANTVEAGMWVLTTNQGVYRGACGLATGSITGFLNPAALQTGTKSKGRGVSLTFTDFGSGWVVQGTTSKGETVTGVLDATVDSTSGSCTNKLGKAFIVTGSLTLDRVP